MNLRGWKRKEGIPDSLLVELIAVFDHLSGSSRDFEKRFKVWLEDNYHIESPLLTHSLGKRILNEYRLAFLEYKNDWENIKRTPEMDYMFMIADAVDVEHGFDAPIDEIVMCKAIEFSQMHGYAIEIIPNKEDVLRKVQMGCHYHPEFKEIRSIALDAIREHSFFNEVVFLEKSAEGFLYEAYNRDALDSPNIINTILVQNGIAKWIVH